MVLKPIVVLAGLGLLPALARAQSSAPGIPPSIRSAQSRLDTSPRHGEWATVTLGPRDSVVVWVVYPERSRRAPVVLVVADGAGLTPWTRAVADQLAADGFIAIAPELLTMRRPGNLMSPWSPDSSRAGLGALPEEVVQRSLGAVARYGMSLPAAEPRYGIIGFGWGGARAFRHATAGSGAAAVVSYDGGLPPPGPAMAGPALGIYGGKGGLSPARLATADSAIERAGGAFRHSVHRGVAPGFLGDRTGRSGDLAAARAWAETIAFLRAALER